MIRRSASVRARDITRMSRNATQACHADDVLINTNGEDIHETVGMHGPMALAALLDENEILRATSDEYRNEIHSKFPDVLVPATGAAVEDADVHPVSVQYALSQWKCLSAFC